MRKECDSQSRLARARTKHETRPECMMREGEHTAYVESQFCRIANVGTYERMAARDIYVICRLGGPYGEKL